MKYVILLSGYPGSGKTAAAEQIRRVVQQRTTAYATGRCLPSGVPVTVLNVDAIRYEVNNGAWYDVHTESQVMRHAYVATKALLSTNDVVVVDEALLMTTQWDRYFTTLFGGTPEKYRVLRARVNTSAAESFRRNSLRDRVVPIEAYVAMIRGVHSHAWDINIAVMHDSVVFEF